MASSTWTIKAGQSQRRVEEVEQIWNRERYRDLTALAERAERYKAGVKRARTCARATCTRVRGNVVVGACALTWATTALLHSALTLRQFVSFAALLLAQAFQFVAIVYRRGFLPDTSLVRRSGQFYLDRFRHFGMLECLYAGVLYMAASSGEFASSTSPAQAAHAPSPSPSAPIEPTVLAIYGFLCLALLNALLSAIGQLIHIWLCFLSSPSLIKYYDRLVWVGLTQGLQGLNQVAVVDDLFEMSSQEFRRERCKPVEVFFAYENMIDYVYRHDRGVEAAQAAMQSTDRYVQEAAVHMIAFWADHHEQRAPEKKLRFARAILQKLVSLCTDNPHGPLGVEAARSIGKLARADPKGVLRAAIGRDEMIHQALVARVVELVFLLKDDRPGRRFDSISHNFVHESLLYMCKTLALLLECDQHYFCERFSHEQLADFKAGLQYLFKNCPASKKRMQVVVGYALHLLDPEFIFKGVVDIAAQSPWAVFDEEREWFDKLVQRGWNVLRDLLIKSSTGWIYADVLISTVHLPVSQSADSRGSVIYLAFLHGVMSAICLAALISSFYQVVKH